MANSDELSDLPLLPLAGTGYLGGARKAATVALPAGVQDGKWSTISVR